MSRLNTGHCLACGEIINPETVRVAKRDLRLALDESIPDRTEGATGPERQAARDRLLGAANGFPIDRLKDPDAQMDRAARMALMRAHGLREIDIAREFGLNSQRVHNILADWDKTHADLPAPTRNEYREAFQAIKAEAWKTAENPGTKHTPGGKPVLGPDGEVEIDTPAKLDALKLAARVTADMMNLDGAAAPKRTITASVELIEQARTLHAEVIGPLEIEAPDAD